MKNRTVEIKRRESLAALKRSGGLSKRRLLGVIAALCWGVGVSMSAAQDGATEWINTNGVKIMAEFVELGRDGLKIRKEGKEFLHRLRIDTGCVPAHSPQDAQL